MKKSPLVLAILSAIALSACGQSKEALLDTAANFVIEKYQNASCEEVADMQPKSAEEAKADGSPDAKLQAKAIELLQNNPELREEFINRVAGPIANRMFDCDLIP